MQRLSPVIAVLLSLPPLPAAEAAEWKPAAGPLLTRWAEEVSPQKALPEYPQPQMVRKEWLNPNGLWDVRLANHTATKILMPFSIESALSGVMRHVDRMTYRSSLDVPKGWSGRHVLLHFGAQKQFKGPVKVFILAGQSNMPGYGRISTADALGLDPTYINTVYTNPIGQVLLTDLFDNINHWQTFRNYDSSNRLLLQAEPSAVLGAKHPGTLWPFAFRSSYMIGILPSVTVLA